MTITTSKYEMFADNMDVVGGDGHDFQNAAMNDGWASLPCWGLDGWDTADWPYVQFFIRKTDDGYRTMYYVEGDLTLEDHATTAEAYAWIDEKVHWHWKHNSNGPDNLDPANPRHCGPFTWKRADAQRVLEGISRLWWGGDAR